MIRSNNHSKCIAALVFAAFVILAAAYLTDRRNRSPQIILTLPEETSEAVFSPDGHTLLTIDNRNIVIWDAETGSLIRRFESPGPVGKALFTNQDQSVVTTLRDTNTALVWDASTWAITAEIRAGGKIYDAASSMDGKYLYTAAFNDAQAGSNFMMVEKWGSGGWTKLYEDQWPTVVQDVFSSLALSSNGELLAITHALDNDESIIRVWNVSAETELTSFSLPTAAYSVIWSVDSRNLIIGGRDSRLHIWSIDPPQETRQVSHLETPNGPIHSFVWGFKSCYLIGGGEHQPTLVWDAKTWQPILNLHDIYSTGIIMGIASSSDGHRVAVTKVVRAGERFERSTTLWDFAGLAADSTC